MTKNCVVCGKEFKTPVKRVTRCSQSCHTAEGRPNWKGDGATANTKRHRARKYLQLREFCDRCKVAKAKDRHHMDGDPGNNHPSNVASLCRRCHMEIDGRLGMRAGMRKVNGTWTRI